MIHNLFAIVIQYSYLLYNTCKENMMLANYHMHTNFSYDSNYPMEECIKKAISSGFDEICFTEHEDYGSLTSFRCNFETYYETFLKNTQQIIQL